MSDFVQRPGRAVATVLRWCAPLLVVIAAAASAVSAQSRAQVQELINRDPQLVRQRIAASGLTSDEIRARLEAAGLPRNLLDAFLPAPALSDAALDQVNQAAAPAPETPQGLERIGVSVGAAAPAPAAGREEGELRLFGLDVFRGRTTQFQPLLTGPVPPSYRVGPGDVLLLVLTGDVELAHELSVTREGFVVVPQVGQIHLAGITMEELDVVFADRLGRAYSGIHRGTTRFHVSVVRLRTNQVFVIGEVAQPGAYRLAAVATVLNGLYAAGGPTERANFRRIEVRRFGTAVGTLDLYDYLLRGATEHDVVLEPGDIVYVPVHATRARIAGAVTRPAIYELEAGETLRDLVAMAGGFRADASLKRIAISRVVPPGQRPAEGPSRVVVDVPLEFHSRSRPWSGVTEGAREENGGSANDAYGVLPRNGGRAGADPAVLVPPFPIEPGDEVRVFAVPDDERGYVTLEGAVYHPGTFAWRRGMRLSDLVQLGGGFKPAVYADRAHIVRLDAADSTRYIVTVALPADSTQPFRRDPPLEEYDVVRIYSRARFREDRRVTIGGMVNAPGPYAYWNGMMLRDLVMLAGGLRDGALLDTAEIARLPADRTGGRLAERLRVPLDSSYLLEPDETSYRFLPGPPAPGNGAPEIPLVPFDHVTILRQPEFEFQRTVSVTGEVRFPGPYALTRKDERVSDLVLRAGGLLPSSYAAGARFHRPFQDAGRVNVSLDRALAHPGSRSDIMLQPGDSLDVPEYLATVRVEGAVNAPSSVMYRDGKGLGYYVENAGGYTRNADRGRVSVRYANGDAKTAGKFLLFRSAPDPGPGSVVMVPAKPEGEPLNVTAFLGSVAQIVAGTIAIVVIATR